MKRIKNRLVIARLIASMPTNRLRCMLYGRLFNYDIQRAYIARKAVLAVDEAVLTGCMIGEQNNFVGPMKVSIGEGARIGPKNNFNCGWWTKYKGDNADKYDRRLEIGADTLITSDNFFDVAGSFVLGDKSWIAGKGSQFWTHGAGVQDRNIIIGERCYIGSSVKFAPGTSVGNNCIVGLGSVVTKKNTAENAVIAGNPASVVRENYDWKTKKSLVDA